MIWQFFELLKLNPHLFNSAFVLLACLVRQSLPRARGALAVGKPGPLDLSLDGHLDANKRDFDPPESLYFLHGKHVLHKLIDVLDPLLDSEHDTFSKPPLPFFELALQLFYDFSLPSALFFLKAVQFVLPFVELLFGTGERMLTFTQVLV